jgi:hypothetical protein
MRWSWVADCCCCAVNVPANRSERKVRKLAGVARYISRKQATCRHRKRGAAFTPLENENDLLRAVEYWRKYGKQNPIEESPTADEALTAFKAWLNGKADSTPSAAWR